MGKAKLYKRTYGKQDTTYKRRIVKNATKTAKT
jgi:hypothetical protein